MIDCGGDRVPVSVIYLLVITLVSLGVAIFERYNRIKDEERFMALDLALSTIKLGCIVQEKTEEELLDLSLKRLHDIYNIADKTQKHVFGRQKESVKNE